MKRIMLLVLPLISLAFEANAQCIATNDAIQAGEELTYKLKFNWKFVWLNAGYAKMNLVASTYNGKPSFTTMLYSTTNRKIDHFFKMRDTLTCITSRQLQPWYFRKGAEEGKRYTVDEIWFSYEGNKCHVRQQRYRPEHGTVHANEKRDECIFDMLSILLQARSYDSANYRIGDRILFQMATGKAIEEQTLIYRGKKNFKAEDGVNYRCLVFSLVEYDKKNREREVITFFVTDDLNHLPVRLDLYLSFGSAKAFLSSIKGNRHPLTSVVEDGR